MLVYYWVAAACGGVLLLLTFVVGHGDGDADTDAGGDFDGDGHAEADWGDAFLAWIPILSLRFLTFFAAFGGLAGVALTLTKSAGSVATLLLAIAVGYVAGIVANRMVRALGKETISSELGAKEAVGQFGTMKLPATPETPGVVRVSMRDRVFELIAEVDEGKLARKQKVMIYQAKDDGHVLVEAVSENEELA